MADTVVTRNDREAVQRPQPQEHRPIYVPNVDISEDKEHIRLVVDVPGADRESVDVTVENSILTIEGEACVDVPKGYELVGREYGVGKYHRDFTLSDEVDVEGIKARVKHGVLEVTIPKREGVKTRKIEIAS